MQRELSGGFAFGDFFLTLKKRSLLSKTRKTRKDEASIERFENTWFPMERGRGEREW